MKRKTKINNSDLFKQADARNDANYWINKITGDKLVSFDEVFEVVEPKKVSIDDLDDAFEYCEIGNLNKNGEVFPVELSMSDSENEDDDNAKLYKKIFKKNSKGEKCCDDIMAVDVGDILVAKTRPILNKVLFIIKEDGMDYSQYYYTKAFIRIRVKNKKVSPIVGYYIIKNLINKELVAVSRIGKSGYPALDKEDLKEIKIPIDIFKLEDKDFNDKIKEIHLSTIKAKQELLIIERRNSEKLNEILTFVKDIG